MRLLTETYSEHIRSILSCFDRIVIQGSLHPLCYAQGMTPFFNNLIPTKSFQSSSGICQWKLDTLKNNLDSNHRVNSVFGLLIQAATGALDGLGGIPLNRSG